MRKMVLTWLLFTLFLAAESAEAKRNVYSPRHVCNDSDTVQANNAFVPILVSSRPLISKI
ncbi:hypothetical protein P4H65_05170 [Paenibacillus chitinolyticus]|uniref:hypothetical protein n=1 Tax=Paenibacillus chitinolyticus TaxID=79263 RepID=UPI002DB69B01|nr:hypothetical protein [Paenibacillus chitinolyticus]MEC0245182.1 hypothetical protein [Paenibacillus chitinolyticus]